jgi:hypothetical protein
MDSDSDSNSSVRSSKTAASYASIITPSSPSPYNPRFKRGPRGEQFLIINYTANQRNRLEILKI